MSWSQCGSPDVAQKTFLESSKVGHVVHVERHWLALYDGTIIGKFSTESGARSAVEQRGSL